MLKESDIKFEKGDYWVFQTPKGGYEVYKVGITHSTRCAQIGYPGEVGLQRSKDEIDRRIARDAQIAAVLALRQPAPCGIVQ